MHDVSNIIEARVRIAKLGDWVVFENWNGIYDNMRYEERIQDGISKTQ